MTTETTTAAAALEDALAALEARLDAVAADLAARAAMGEQIRAQAEAAARAARLSDLAVLLARDLAPDPARALAFVPRYDAWGRPALIGAYRDVPIVLRWLAEARDPAWEIRFGDLWTETAAPPDRLEDRLLAALVRLRDRLATEARRQAFEAQQLAAQATARAAALAEHQRCQQLVEAALAAEAYAWPAGRGLVFYEWGWCVAPATEEGCAVWDEGFSLQRAPNDDGFIRMWRPARGEELLRLFTWNCPIVVRRLVRSVADLPAALIERTLVEVSGVARVPYQEADDESPLLAAAPGQTLAVSGAPRPVAWVRALLDDAPAV